MATMILLPNATPFFDSEWVALGESTHHECLDDDNDDTSVARCSPPTKEMKLEFADPSVAEGDIDTIDSVRFLSSGRANDRSNIGRVNIKYNTPSGNATQSPVYNPERDSYTTVNGTARAHANGTSGGWSYANLESLVLGVEKADAVEVYLSYLALEVTYTEAVATADNATFFGANF